MTVCVGAICTPESAVVVASDRMLTAYYLDAEFEHSESKIIPLGARVVGLTSGDAIAKTEIFNECLIAISQYQDPSVGGVAKQVCDVFSQTRRKNAEDIILKPRGMSLDYFYRNMNLFPPDLAVKLDYDITNTNLNLDIIIAGVDRLGAHLYLISDPGICRCYDNFGYCAIGSGMRHATLTVTAGAHSQKKSLAETIYAVYEAKKNAEISPGVGNDTDITVIGPNGLIPLKDAYKEELEKIYAASQKPHAAEIERLAKSISFLQKEKGEAENDEAKTNNEANPPMSAGEPANEQPKEPRP